MAAAIVEVSLAIVRSGQKPSRDIIVALCAGEETGGFAGARWLTTGHKDLIDAELALNEGGSILLTPDLSRERSGVSRMLPPSFKASSASMRSLCPVVSHLAPAKPPVSSPAQRATMMSRDGFWPDLTIASETSTMAAAIQHRL